MVVEEWEGWQKGTASAGNSPKKHGCEGREGQASTSDKSSAEHWLKVRETGTCL